MFCEQGPAAVAANNVFYHLTYESVVTKMNITDPMERRATEVSICFCT